MNRALPLLSSLLLLLWLPGCSAVQGFFALIGPPPAPSSYMRQSVLDRLAPAVRKDFEQLTGSHHTDLLTAHKAVEKIPAQFKRRLALKALKQPWEGLTDLERQGLLLAEMAEGGAVNLPALLDVLEAGMDRTSTFYKPVPLPTSSSRDRPPGLHGRKLGAGLAAPGQSVDESDRDRTALPVSTCTIDGGTLHPADFEPVGSDEHTSQSQSPVCRTT